MADNETSTARSTRRFLDAARVGALRIMERRERDTRTLLANLRPRLALTGGSLLVLLTLFCPIGYEACGAPRKGYELVQGQGDWPSFLGIIWTAGGQGFYLICLLLAGTTLLSVLLSLAHAGVFRNPSLTRGMFRLSGTVSLFLIFDLYLLVVSLAKGWARAPAYILAALSCLGPGLVWPRRVFIAWLCVIAGWVSMLFIVAALARQTESPSQFLLILFEAVVALLPIAMWLRYSLSRSAATRTAWPAIRAGLVAFYAPAVVGDVWLMVLAIQEGLWGLPPSYFGVLLMAIGFMRLAKVGKPTSVGAS